MYIHRTLSFMHKKEQYLVNTKPGIAIELYYMCVFLYITSYWSHVSVSSLTTSGLVHSRCRSVESVHMMAE